MYLPPPVAVQHDNYLLFELMRCWSRIKARGSLGLQRASPLFWGKCPTFERLCFYLFVSRNIESPKQPSMACVTVLLTSFVLYRLFTSHPEIGPLFPDVKNCQDLLEMRKRQRLNGHPEKIVAVLNEALKAMDDAAIFYAKMEGVGKLMANVGLDLESLKVSKIS